MVFKQFYLIIYNILILFILLLAEGPKKIYINITKVELNYNRFRAGLNDNGQMVSHAIRVSDRI